MKNNTIECFDELGLPASCSFFLEPAITYYNQEIPPVNLDTKKYIHEWNNCLVDILKSKYTDKMGDMGRKILRGIQKRPSFSQRCVESAPDVHLQSLHYAFRFSKANQFLVNKYKKTSTDNFSVVDLGCGLSPLAAVCKSVYNIGKTYCIEISQIIADIYTQVSYKISGTSPDFIPWSQAKDMAKNKSLNTITSLGCLPYMEKQEQVERIKFIHKYMDNYFIEIRFNSDNSETKNTFTLSDLTKYRLQFENSQTIEAELLQNSSQYLRCFLKASKYNKDFILHDRSLFLSR